MCAIKHWFIFTTDFYSHELFLLFSLQIKEFITRKNIDLIWQKNLQYNVGSIPIEGTSFIKSTVLAIVCPESNFLQTQQIVRCTQEKGVLLCYCVYTCVVKLQQENS